VSIIGLKRQTLTHRLRRGQDRGGRYSGWSGYCRAFRDDGERLLSGIVFEGSFWSNFLRRKVRHGKWWEPSPATSGGL